MANIIQEVYIAQQSGDSVVWSENPYNIGTKAEYVEITGAGGAASTFLNDKLDEIDNKLSSVPIDASSLKIAAGSTVYGQKGDGTGTVQGVFSTLLPANTISNGKILYSNSGKIAASNLTKDEAATIHTYFSKIQDVLIEQEYLKLPSIDRTGDELIATTENINSLTCAGTSPILQIGQSASSTSASIALASTANTSISLAGTASSISLKNGQIYNDGDTSIGIRPGTVTDNAGDIKLTVNGTGAILAPNVDEAVSLGSTVSKWKDIYANSIDASTVYPSRMVFNKDHHIVWQHGCDIFGGGTWQASTKTPQLILSGGDAGGVGANTDGLAEINLKSQSTGGSRLYPTKDHKMVLGNAGNRFVKLYADSIDNSSDRKLKKNINTISSEYIQFFNKLIPVNYQFIDDLKNTVHIGFVAQDVQAAAQESNLNSLAMLNKEIIENGEQRYFLNYLEFIALNTAVIQQQQKTIDDLSTRLAALEAKIN